MALNNGLSLAFMRDKHVTYYWKIKTEILKKMRSCQLHRAQTPGRLDFVLQGTSDSINN